MHAYIHVQDIVVSLGLLSAESTAAVSPALQRLQMLQTLSDSWLLQWPSAATVSLLRCPPSPTATMHAVSVDALLSKWKQRERLTGALIDHEAPLRLTAAIPCLTQAD
jgi:hypothetical protein